MKTKNKMLCPHCVAVGAEMRGLRIASGYSLRALARNMGISAMFLSDMETGRRFYTDKWRQKFKSLTL